MTIFSLDEITGFNASSESEEAEDEKTEGHQDDETENNNNEGNGQQNPKKDTSNPKSNPVFKYTSNGQVFESIILAGNPVFLTIGNNGNNDEVDSKITLKDEIVESTRVLRPPAIEEYPSYFPYAFESEEEVKEFVKLIKNSQRTVSVDALFLKTREYVSRFIVHKDHVLDYISSLIVLSYFQDKFPTIPYTMFVSDNGSGKSTIGNVFEVLGYRCVNMTDPTTANIFRIFGTIESGQCILVLDEAEKIDQEREMMSILKTGYENGKKVQRISHLGKQEHFHTFGLKLMLAERTPSQLSARRVMERTFVIPSYRGRPQLEIKEIKIAQDNPIKNELLFIRKLLLVYRLLNCNTGFAEIETGLEGRNKELCKPLLQLFYQSKSQGRIEKALEMLLDDKNDRKANSLERDVLEVVAELLKAHPNGIIPFHSIWKELTIKTNGILNSLKEHELETEAYGTIYKRTISNMLRDKFGAKPPKTRTANMRSLVFDKKEIENHIHNYVTDSNPTKINCSPTVSDSSDSNDCNPNNLFAKFVESIPNPDGDEYDGDGDITNSLNNKDNNDEAENQSTGIKQDFVLSENKDGVKEEAGVKGLSDTVTTVTEPQKEADKTKTIPPFDEINFEIENGSMDAVNQDNAVSSNNNSIIDSKVGFRDPLYYCKQHPQVQNIHLEEIEHHIQYSKDHV